MYGSPSLPVRFCSLCFCAAKLAAESLPQRIEAQLGEQTLATIDKSFCAPTKLEPARQAALRQRFAALTAGLNDGYAYQVELRNCRIGARENPEK